MLSDLPQELLELIFTALDQESLRACALVSSSLVAPSQRSIFRSLAIRIPDGDIPKAQALLSSAPHVTGYVRELKVRLEDEEALSSQNGVLASILPSFPHLECLSIKGWFGPIRWNHMTLPLQSAVEELMTSSNLRSLDLEEILDIPSSFIVLALSSLRRLGLHSITVQSSEIHIPNRPVTLRTEQIILLTQYSNVQSIVDLILPNIPRPGYLDKIRWLVLGMHQDIHAESLRFIASTANTLRRLELRCGVFQTPLDLPRLPVLRVLELRFFLGSSAGLPPHLYPAVAALPTTVPSIEVLCLTFYGAVPDEEDWGGGPLPLFDDACAYRAKLPSLQRVHCHGWPDWLHEEDRATFSAYVLGKFPGLRGTGVLEISTGSESPPGFD
ncbi:hypothetical protein B0H14DRAFT_3456957 [Mycena olivaceomarginata]|nr:hypothetical protein B0H14DRAFT_3456957 [Mycena olivaceomarginata]